jgi:prophage maintenance system killer protein
MITQETGTQTPLPAGSDDSAESVMEYLTVHDLVWINTVVTGEPAEYDYVTLESVMAGQYSYGDSQNVPAQAAKMLRRLVETRPFAAGNLRTALLAILTFFNANGHATLVSDAEAARILLAVADGEMELMPAVAMLAAPAQSPLKGITLRQLITHECNHHLEALKILADHDGPVASDPI